MQANDFITTIHNYVMECSGKLENVQSFPQLASVSEFPSVDSIMLNGIMNWKAVSEKIANYEFAQVQLSNLLSDMMIKRTQSKMFINQIMSGGMTPISKQTADQINFYISRLSELELVIKVRLEAIEKCITALRTIKSDAPR